MSWHATGALAAGFERIGPRSEPESAAAEIFELGDRALVGALECFEELRRRLLAEPDSVWRILKLAIVSMTQTFTSTGRLGTRRGPLESLLPRG
jgi:hypothetical protein